MPKTAYTHEEFLEILFDKNQCFREGLFTVESNYINSYERILVKDKYGYCTISPRAMFQGTSTSIRSAVDKNDYFKNRAIEIHGYKFDYSEVYYINNSSKVKIICKKHGVFLQEANSHLKGNGCKSCSVEYTANTIRSTTQDFIKKAKEIHGERYDYTKTVYVNNRNKLIITCRLHGDFLVRPGTHISKTITNCSKCGDILTGASSRENGGWSKSTWCKRGENSKNFDSFKVYIIKCWNDNEEFYKIGRTFQNLKQRFKCSTDIPYNYKIIKIVEGDCEYIYNLENILQKDNVQFNYIPKISFGGMYECFSKINRNLRNFEI